MPSRTRNRKKAKQKTSLAALPGARTQEEHSNNGPTYVQDENLAQGDGNEGWGGGGWTIMFFMPLFLCQVEQGMPSGFRNVIVVDIDLH